MKKDQTLMTEGPIGLILIRFALPLFVGNLFQQLYNAVDSLVVGNFCGDIALAAVSSSGSLCHLLIGFFQGAFVGASVLISRHYGMQDMEKTDRAVSTTVVFSLVAGVVLSVFGVLFTPTILRWMGTPETVMPESVLYFRVYCAGLMGLVLYNMATGIFRALGDSRHPLYYLMIAAVVNAVLDLLFVGWLDMGVGGAALATVIGQALSAILAIAHLVSGRFIIRLDLKRLCYDAKMMVQVLRLGLPSGVQNSVIAIANLVVQSNINKFGDQAMAGCGSYFKLEGFVNLPVMCITLAMTTFISQNLGAKRYDRVKRGALLGSLMTVAAAEIVGLTLFFFAPFLIGLFSKTPEVAAFGIQQSRIEGLFYFMMGYSKAAGSILQGSGRSMTPMVIMLATWCAFRICYITIFVNLIPDIRVVFSGYPITWFLSAVLFSIALWKENWQTQQI